MYLPDSPSGVSIKGDLGPIYNSFSKGSEIADNFSINEQNYSPDEFEKLWGDTPGAMYLLSYKPEILKYKDLFEAIRKTKKIKQITLEGDGSKGFVVQLSDLCIKFNNEDIKNSLKGEYDNYKLVEKCYSELGHNKYFHIPTLENNLCTNEYITMEYIPGFTLLLHDILKRYKISPNTLYNFINKNSNEYEDLGFIKSRLEQFPDINSTNITQYIKEHEVITTLIYIGLDEKLFTFTPNIDPLDIIYRSFDRNKKDYIKTYKQWQAILKRNGISSIEDHPGNLKIHDNKLYGLDFGNVTYTSKYK